MIRSVSRVLCSTVIYLDAGLLRRSSHLLGSGRAGLASSAVLLRIEFAAMDASTPSGALLPHLSTLTALGQRYISVALFLKSPSAGVTRYPCPVEPGLSSCTAFRHSTRDCPIWSQVILPDLPPLVNCAGQINKL